LQKEGKVLVFGERIRIRIRIRNFCMLLALR